MEILGKRILIEPTISEDEGLIVSSDSDNKGKVVGVYFDAPLNVGDKVIFRKLLEYEYVYLEDKKYIILDIEDILIKL